MTPNIYWLSKYHHHIQVSSCMDFQALGCGATDWPKALSKIQTERKDLAKKGKLLTEEVATAAGDQIAKNFSEGSSVHYHRQASMLLSPLAKSHSVELGIDCKRA
jgi:hypothetical protein